MANGQLTAAPNLKIGDKVRTLRPERFGLYGLGACGALLEELTGGVWVVQFDEGQHSDAHGGRLAVSARWLEFAA